MPKALRFTVILIGLLGLYLGWTYYSRWSDKKSLMERLDAEAESQNSPLPDVYGGGRLTIIAFYTTAPVIRMGETAQLCYGVASAESVRIEPPVEHVWPSASRCVDVAPTTDTVYKLVAEDADGNIDTAEATIKIHRE